MYIFVYLCLVQIILGSWRAVRVHLGLPEPKHLEDPIVLLYRKVINFVLLVALLGKYASSEVSEVRPSSHGAADSSIVCLSACFCGCDRPLRTP